MRPPPGACATQRRASLTRFPAGGLRSIWLIAVEIGLGLAELYLLHGTALAH